MPRETKVELEAKEAREQDERQIDYSKAYPVRLMFELGRASKHMMDIYVKDGKFIVVCRHDDSERLELSYRICPMDWYDPIESLHGYLNELDAEKAEADRKAILRSQALSKLTKEEKEELGLL